MLCGRELRPLVRGGNARMGQRSALSISQHPGAMPPNMPGTPPFSSSLPRAPWSSLQGQAHWSPYTYSRPLLSTGLILTLPASLLKPSRRVTGYKLPGLKRRSSIKICWEGRDGKWAGFSLKLMLPGPSFLGGGLEQRDQGRNVPGKRHRPPKHGRHISPHLVLKDVTAGEGNAIRP